MKEEKTFYCLRCQARFPGVVEKDKVFERTCPKCLSNSVRQETPLAAKALAEREARRPRA